MAAQFADHPIAAMVAEHRQLIDHLQSTSAISLKNVVEPAFAKTLLISAASYYEHRMTEVLVGLYESDSNGGPTALAEFVRNQAIGRRYAQLFDWNRNNANGFFSSFGSGFRAYMEQRVRNDQDLDESIKAFLELGKFRNIMIHGNYMNSPLDKTIDEVFELCQKANIFVEGFADNVTEYLGR